MIGRPIENSYVVPHSLLVAGEYPGSRPGTPVDQAEARVERFLQAGIRAFIDLTDPADALEPYEPTLRRVADRLGVEAHYRRLTIRDMDVCDRLYMSDLIDEIDAFLAQGTPTYVHCWGGVGRTGMVMGCWMVRDGATGEVALEQVAALFATMSAAKRRRHAPTGSPQTDAQRAMVRTWADNDAALLFYAAQEAKAYHARDVDVERWRRITPRPDVDFALRNRLRGALMGLAAGDAVGTTVEFKAPGSFAPVRDMMGGGPFNLAPGEWTDDTSMALCLAHSLIERRALDPLDQMQRYQRWYQVGYLSSTGRCFDIGNTVRRALQEFARTGEPLSGSTDEQTAGNGSLMRLAPLVMMFQDHTDVLELSATSSRTTHGATVAVDCCRYLAALLVGAIRGVSKAELLAPYFTPLPGCWDAAPLHPVVAQIANGSYKHKAPPAIKGTGYAADALEAALWAFYHSRDFREGCLLAVNLGDDADTTAAIYGQIAGAFYGESGIPARWRRQLANRPLLDHTAEFLFQLAYAPLPSLGPLSDSAAQQVEQLVAEADGDADAALVAWLNAEVEAKAEMGTFAYLMNGSMHAQARRAEVHLRLRVEAGLSLLP
ncbi:ADP-ribosylglycohydrolase family protein [Gemmatimonas sp.]|uniref:ADP-ribosylglycohydrolase family protein n=1 Tax=Gemmatimonas sp. TaxID=1962908 RepID=UPI0025B7E5AD|nr:ADP-ribosylglycohydrolase family protein [Gemmatimonas sp.]